MEILVPEDGSYSIRIKQEGKVNQITTNGGSSSIMSIKHGC